MEGPAFYYILWVHPGLEFIMDIWDTCFFIHRHWLVMAGADSLEADEEAGELFYPGLIACGWKLTGVSG